ncbi:TrbC/VirB2 family protein [Anaplasma centrale]|nr:TrbC/VirB2 family protein [Anaplasma centrale]
MLHGVPAGAVGDTAEADDTATKVICNVIGFVQKLGLPIMTGVILGSSIMAIFGKLAWPAIVMLVVFTAIFFGAGKLMAKFAAGLNSDGVNAQSFKCEDGGRASLGS